MIKPPLIRINCIVYPPLTRRIKEEKNQPTMPEGDLCRLVRERLKRGGIDVGESAFATDDDVYKFYEKAVAIGPGLDKIVQKQRGRSKSPIRTENADNKELRLLDFETTTAELERQLAERKQEHPTVQADYDRTAARVVHRAEERFAPFVELSDEQKQILIEDPR